MQQARRRVLSTLSDAWAAAVAGSGTHACASSFVDGLSSCSAGSLTVSLSPVGRRTLSSHLPVAVLVCRPDAGQYQHTRQLQPVSLLQTADGDQQGAGIDNGPQQPDTAGISLHADGRCGGTGTQPSLAAAALLAAAAPAEAGVADGFGPVVAAMQLMDGLHAATGLPWWATLSATAVGVRLAMLPLTLQQMRAAAATLPLFKQARSMAAAEAAGPSGAAAASQRTPGGSQSRESEAEEAATAAAAQQHSRSSQPDGSQAAEVVAAAEAEAVGVRPSMAQTAELFRQLRQAAGAPHPGWILAAPLIQLPVFVTAMWATRRMALAPWPGLSDGGVLWFPDLTVPALDLGAQAVQGLVPLGSMGIVLPASVAAVMFACVSSAFGTAAPGGRQRGAVEAWLMGKLRLFLEWLTVPMLLVALQLPHASLCYWLASGLATLGQHHLLRLPAVRSAAGLNPPAPVDRGRLLDRRPPPGSHAAHSASVDAEAEALAAGSSSVDVLFQKSAEYVAAHQAGSARRLLQRIIELRPQEPRAFFALGQVNASLGDWSAAAAAYRSAANAWGADTQQRARALLGCGVALDRQGDVERALSALLRAAELAAPAAAAPTAAPQPQQTFAVRPRKGSRRRQGQQGGAESSSSRSAAANHGGAAGNGVTGVNDSGSSGIDGTGGTAAAAGDGATSSSPADGVNAAAPAGSTVGSGGSNGSGKETAVRALLSAGSMLARVGRKQEAADIVRRAVALDPRLHEKFLKPLEVEFFQN